jgi:DNA-directed RNA polymerase subunit beta
LTSSVERINPAMNGDAALAEELMAPGGARFVDASRALMASSQINQSVVLMEGEFPRVFSGYENQVGKYSSSFLVADKDWTVVKVIRKNDFNSAYILYDPKKDLVHIVYRKPCKGLSEGFGYAYENGVLDSKVVGSKIKKGETLYRSTAYDEHGNFSFGMNLRAVYMPWHGMTYEDAIVISRPAAEKMDTWGVEHVDVSVNTNDFLLNLYGDKETYRAFPDVGEEVVGRILCSRRRIHNDSMLHDMSSKAMAKVNYNTDTPFYSDGIVMDIEVFSNEPAELLERHKHYNGQVCQHLATNMEYHREIRDALAPWVAEGKGAYTDEAAHAYRRSADIIDPGVRWRNNSSNFDNYIIRFSMLYRNQLTVGSKITNRYGGKGVISTILEESEMPLADNGERAEILLNPLGVINRLNPAQLFEQEINMISDQVLNHINESETESVNEFLDMVTEYIHDVNPVQAEAFREYLGNPATDERWAEAAREIREHGIHIHQPPFHGGLNIDGFRDIYRKYDYVKPYEFEDVAGKIVMGDIYYMRLKHEPRDKFSARSSSYLNLKNVPSKSTRFKQHQQLFSHTPIRFGEMELFNMLASGQMGEVLRMISQFSSNEKDREGLIEALLTRNVLDMEHVQLTGSESNVQTVLSVYLKSVGLKLTADDSEEESETVQQNADEQDEQE